MIVCFSIKQCVVIKKAIQLSCATELTEYRKVGSLYMVIAYCGISVFGAMKNVEINEHGIAGQK